MVVKERFGLEANAFNGLVYYGPDSNMEAAELLLVNLKDISQKESVEEAIQNESIPKVMPLRAMVSIRWSLN